MTPKEKAIQLVDVYLFVDDYHTLSKQCALIAVDEIIDAVDWHEFEVPNDVLHYYFEVKQEIEKL